MTEPTNEGEPQDRVRQIFETQRAKNGEFQIMAILSQIFKRMLIAGALVRSGRGLKSLSPSQTEALQMIAHKMSRIYAGDPNHADHWDDIAGYATLCADEIRKKAAKDG